jgi:hypothetical protein
MPVRAVDDKPSDTLVVVSGEGFWTGSSTLPHLHHFISAMVGQGRDQIAAGPRTGTSSQPSRTARTASSVREGVEVRAKIRPRADSTLLVVIPRASPISSF